jgi:HPt (histidine-containing phosphotransfer) domain-containing protein
MNSLAYSRKELLESVDGDEEVAQEVITIYLNSAPFMLRAISGALDQNDAAAVADAAHSLKGALIMLRAHPAAAVAKEIEMASRRGDLTAARVKLPVLKVEAQRLDSALLAYSNSPGPDGAG